MFPTGLGMGATQDGCEDISPTRAAGIFWAITVADPFAIMPGPAGTQGTNVQIFVMSAMRAAGIFPIRTVVAPGGIIGSGKAGCGTGVGVGAGGWIGAWQCGAVCKTLSVTRAAGGIMDPFDASTRKDRPSQPTMQIPHFM